MRKLWIPFVALCLVLGFSLQAQPKHDQAPVTAGEPPPSHGYDIHVIAPHKVDGKEMGPYHHYCKVIGDGPQIQCLIYDTTDPNAPLSQVEWIYAKKMTRTS